MLLPPGLHKVALLLQQYWVLFIKDTGHSSYPQNNGSHLIVPSLCAEYRVPQLPQHHSVVWRLVGALLNLVTGAWRLVVLLTMFAPVMATGHLAMTHGYHRAQWLSWLRRALSHPSSYSTE